MVLPDPDEIHAERIGEHRFVNQVANDLSVREWFPVRADSDVAERIEPKFQQS